MDREDWGSLAAFAVVAEERSFTRAATRLGVSPSALSHTLRRLEERVRIRLLARSTRSVSTTEAGERLLARLGPALEAIANAVEDLGRLLDRPSGHVRITTSRSAARMVVAPVLPRFTQAYPEIVLEIVIDPGLTNIVAQRFDAGIRLGESLDKDVVAVPVSGPQRMAVVGAPQYFASRPPPATPHDLRTHRCINFRLPSPAPGTLYKWEFEKAHHSIELAVEGRSSSMTRAWSSTLRWPVWAWGTSSRSRWPPCFRRGSLCACSRTGVRRFPASFSTTPDDANYRPPSPRSSTPSACPPGANGAADRRLRAVVASNPVHRLNDRPPPEALGLVNASAQRPRLLMVTAMSASRVDRPHDRGGCSP